jgi:hypothetical protein
MYAIITAPSAAIIVNIDRIAQDYSPHKVRRIGPVFTANTCRHRITGAMHAIGAASN